MTILVRDIHPAHPVIPAVAMILERLIRLAEVIVPGQHMVPDRLIAQDQLIRGRHIMTMKASAAVRHKKSVTVKI